MTNMIDEQIEKYLRLIAEFFPQEIEAHTLHGSGDDFVVIEVNQAWMFRFPRNELSRKAMGNETNFLTEFDSVSPLPVPAQTYIGEDFVGYQKILGQQLSFELFDELSESARKRIARQLGEFLSAIHSFPVEKADSVGITCAWNGMHHKTGLLFLEQVASKLSPTARKKSILLMESLLAEEFEEKVIHGDFYLPDHVFYDESRQGLSGVIDFGDVTVYDPAHDWQCILEVGGEEFFDEAIEYYQTESDANLLKRSNMRLDARPLFVAGNIFLYGIEEQYTERLARIEAKFG